MKLPKHMLPSVCVVLASLALLTLPLARGSQHAEPGHDLTTIQGTIDAIYATISGNADDPRDWDYFRSLFVEEAQLRSVQQNTEGEFSLRSMSVDQYIEGASKFFEQSNFYESELDNTAVLFGHITHVFSTYESKRSTDDAQPFARGINSIQLYTDGTRWYIVSILWDSERDNQPIPDQYLGM